MPKTKIYRLSPETIELCKNKIAERNPSLDNGDLVYAEDILIAKALGNKNFKYLGPLADKNNKPSTLSTLKKFLFALGIIDSKSASIDHLTVPDEQPSVAASNPPAKHIEISGAQKNSAGFCFLPDDAREIKDRIEATKGLSQRNLSTNAGRKGYVSSSLNKKPVHFVDFIEILKALIDRNIVTLKKGTTIESLLKFPDVDEKNPLGLSKEDIHFRGSWISLSKTARDKINGLLFKKNLDIETLVSKNNLNEDTLRGFLKGTEIHKNSFLTILNLLAQQGVLEKPKTSFDALLSFDLVQENFQTTKPKEGETRLLLRQAAADQIRVRLKAQQIIHPKIANQAELKPQMVRDFLSGEHTINPENLKKILRVLLDHQIITLPEGSNLDAFVAGVAAMEPSFSRTSATAAGCASVGRRWTTAAGFRRRQ